MRHFIFDVDGTLTPSRGKIDSEFKEYLLDLGKKEYLYAVTGSDYTKTFEQLGSTLAAFQISYNCSGNSVHVKGTEMWKSDWELPENMRKWLEGTLKNHPYKVKTGNHIEDRPGLVNFSIVGRNAMPEERANYVEYDTKTSDRIMIAKQFNKLFTKKGVHAQVAGETGLDIVPVGAGKSQILGDFDMEHEIYFFGDKCMEGGNDYDIAQTLKVWPNAKVIQVMNWQDTFNCLQSIINEV